MKTPFLSDGLVGGPVEREELTHVSCIIWPRMQGE